MTPMTCDPVRVVHQAASWRIVRSAGDRMYSRKASGSANTRPSSSCMPHTPRTRAVAPLRGHFRCPSA